MSQPSDRRKVFGFKSERQAAFSRNVRKAYLDDGRKQKDAERARMDAYRKLCAEEGIVSKRLEEYDRTREAASKQLSAQLEEVDYDQSLTNNEKKKRKYSLKRKYAATTVTDLLDKKKKKYSAFSSAEDLHRQREAERETARGEKEQREKEKKQKIKARKTRNALFTKKTKKGQPMMSSRIENLLHKI